MTQPSEYTLTDRGDTLGLHRYPDGLFIFQQHKSGEWNLWRKAKPEEVAIFEQHGTRTAQPAPNNQSRPLAPRAAGRVKEHTMTPQRRVTFASMIMTDGPRTVNGVYRGILRNRKNGEKYVRFDESTEQIATVESVSGNHMEDVRRLSRQYATPAEAPAWEF